ncbi:MAG: DsrE family protein [Planctomycetales bacterium]|nr:DsrE family protein [Planctomycetales bacterium]
MDQEKQVVVVLTTGKSDNGKNATLAFSCGLSALALGQNATVFLTSDGAVWGYRDSAEGIAVQGFSPLQTLIDEFLQAGGQVLLCSVCHRTCSAGGPNTEPSTPRLPEVQAGGFATVVELALQGVSFTF